MRRASPRPPDAVAVDRFHDDWVDPSESCHLVVCKCASRVRLGMKMVWMDQGRSSGSRFDGYYAITPSSTDAPCLVTDTGLVVASTGATFAALMWGVGGRGVIVA